MRSPASGRARQRQLNTFRMLPSHLCRKRAAGSAGAFFNGMNLQGINAIASMQTAMNTFVWQALPPSMLDRS
jgi:hypothetical protein